VKNTTQVTANGYKYFSDRRGIQFRDDTHYVTSDRHTYYCKVVITYTSEGKEKWKPEFVQGSGKYESGRKYIAHPIRVLEARVFTLKKRAYHLDNYHIMWFYF